MDEDMAKALRIGIVGCGAIGGSLAKIIRRDFRGQAILSGFFDSDALRAQKLAVVLRSRNLAVVSLSLLLSKSDLIIEASHARSSYDIARKALQASCDVLIMSVGGVIDRKIGLARLCKRYKRRVYIPCGALCGLDGLKAAAQARISEVTLTTMKPPKGFGLKGLKKEKVLFSGSAREAVRRFPQNINVAAALSLAGIGAQKTRVRIVASPKVKRNTHEIRVVSDAGTVQARTENVLHPDNPKTSYLAVLSAVALLRQILSPVKIGN